MTQSTIDFKSNHLADNPHVQELFSILKENDKDTAGLSALLSYVKRMEDFLQSADTQISDMNSQINEIMEIQKHPIKTAMKSAAESLETRVNTIRERLGKIRDAIVDACKNAVAAVKETGVAALDKLAGFFHIKQGLEAIEKSCSEGIKRCGKSIKNIEKFSAEYHKTGLHLKNMARLVVGKEPIDTAKEIGKLAKSACAPYKLESKCLSSIRDTAKKACLKLEELGKSADKISKKQKNSPGIEKHISAYEEKARKINAEKSAETMGKVIEFKPRDEAVTI